MGLGCTDVATGNTTTCTNKILGRVDTDLDSVGTQSISLPTKRRLMRLSRQAHASEGKKTNGVPGWPQGSQACGGKQTHHNRRQAADNQYANRELGSSGNTSVYTRKAGNTRRSGSVLKNGGSIGAPQLQRQSLNGRHENANRTSIPSCCPLHIFGYILQICAPVLGDPGTQGPLRPALP